MLLLASLMWIVYQTTLCPLSKFPGPFWAKVNPLWPLYQFFTGERHKTFKHLHHKYGDIVRVGINELSVCNVEAPKAIYGQNSNFIKAPRYNMLPQGLKYPTILSETDPFVHSLLRKQLSNAFSTKALHSMENYVNANIKAFCYKVRECGRNGEMALDMSDWTRFLAFDILGDLCFGKSFGFLEDGTVNPLMTCILHNNYFSGMLMSCPGLLPILRLLSPNHLKKARMQLGEQTKSMIDERIANPSDRKDFFYYITNPERLKSAPQYFYARLQPTCASLIVAGGGTTSTVINGAIYLLATHHTVLEKLHQELTKNFPDPTCDIEHQKTANLPYLNAFIEESMRLFTSGLGPFPRVSSQENLVVGQMIPRKCVISTASYAISGDPRYFTRPESFIPERWTDPGYGRDQTLGKLALQPFSLGPRGCLGRNMACMEIRLFLAHFVLQFRPELKDPNLCYENRDHWVAFTPPLFIKCHPLKGGSA